jgi:hypothetical protein
MLPSEQLYEGHLPQRREMKYMRKVLKGYSPDTFERSWPSWEEDMESKAYWDYTGALLEMESKI